MIAWLHCALKQNTSKVLTFITADPTFCVSAPPSLELILSLHEHMNLGLKHGSKVQGVRLPGNLKHFFSHIVYLEAANLTIILEKQEGLFS